MNRWRIVALALVVPAALAAQQPHRVRLQLFGVRSTNQEVDSTRNATGQGGGGSIELSYGRFSVEASGYQASLTPDDPALVDYKLKQGDIRVYFRVLNPDQVSGVDLAVMLGGGGRTMDPALAATEVGTIRFGVRARAPLTRLAELAVRGAYLAPKFSGGGTSKFAFEVGLDLGIGTSNGRFRFQAGFDFQRIDRSVGGLDVPIQFTTSRGGFQLAL